MELDEAVLLQWQDTIRYKETSLNEQIALKEAEFERTVVDIRCELVKTKEMARLVEGLICLLRNGTRWPPVQGASGGGTDQGMGSRLRAVCYDVLKSEGQPLFYKDLADRVSERGVAINSKDPATYIIAYIGKDERFKRVGRGTYGLSEWQSGKSTSGQKKRAKAVGRHKRASKVNTGGK